VNFASDGSVDPSRSIAPHPNPLLQLPCSIVQTLRKGEIVYQQGQRSSQFCLILEGKVELVRSVAGRADPMVIDVYGKDDFFGESAFITFLHPETAIALEQTRLMVWTVEEINELLPARPKLALALIQFIVQRSLELEGRIEALAVESIPSRLVRALVHFSERFGIRENDGLLHMPPFRHRMLGQYVGTSREVISEYMSKLRNEGCIRYSRTKLTVDPAALAHRLTQGRQSAVTGKAHTGRLTNTI
jgi:CRP-like cAMP-binding protein